jgi:hypothetical protein
MLLVVRRPQEDNRPPPQSRSCPVSCRLIAPFLVAAAMLASGPSAAQVFGGADRDVPLARFQDALCPGVVGVQVAQAQDIVGLIRENAAMLGLRLADSQTCDPNLIVAVIADPVAYLDGLMKRRPDLLHELDGRQRERLLKGSGPARTWARIVVRTRDGMMVARRENLDELPETTVQMAHSKIYKATRRDIISAMVFVDPAAAHGLSVAQIADYATMRALSDDAGDQLHSPRPTILGLFDAGADKPAGLTDSDWTFLRTLYSTPANDPAAITLAMASDRIARGKPTP